MAGEFIPTTNAENSQENGHEKAVETAIVELEAKIGESENYVGERNKDRIETFLEIEALEKNVGDAKDVLAGAFNALRNGDPNWLDQLSNGKTYLAETQALCDESKGKSDQIKNNTEVAYNGFQEAGAKMDRVASGITAEPQAAAAEGVAA